MNFWLPYLWRRTIDHLPFAVGLAYAVVIVLMALHVAAQGEEAFQPPVEDNLPPVILNQPPETAHAGSLYSLELEGFDPDWNPLFWRLEKAPPGATLIILWQGIADDPAERIFLVWRPLPSDVGKQMKFQLSLDDGKWAYDRLLWHVDVLPWGTYEPEGNTAPVIISEPDEDAVVGMTYVTSLQALDVDQDVTLWRLEDAPSGAKLGPWSGYTRYVVWQPGPECLGRQFRFRVICSDSLGGEDVIQWHVRVVSYD